MRTEIPQQCLEILQRFQDAGYEAYLVGGCVRDSLLGKQPKDWDICTSALPEATQKLFANEKVILTGLQHGTVTVLMRHLPIEITTYRIDGAYSDNRRPDEVFFTNNLQEDLSRRDFTMNALAYHPEKGIMDFFHGKEDLEAGILRCVGVPKHRYEEDGLRIMRAIRFACVLNLEYDPETKSAIESCNYLLQNIARERIQVELNQILTHENVSKGIMDLRDLGCYPYFLPELNLTPDIIDAIAKVPQDLATRWATLLYHFDENPQTCAVLAGKALDQLHYDKKTMQEVVRILQARDRAWDDTDYAVRRGVADYGEETLLRIWALQSAFAQNLQTHFNALQLRLEQISNRNECCSLKQLAVNGKDMIAAGYKGAAVGEQLERLLEMVLRNPSCNTKEYLLKQLDRK